MMILCGAIVSFGSRGVAVNEKESLMMNIW